MGPATRHAVHAPHALGDDEGVGFGVGSAVGVGAAPKLLAGKSQVVFKSKWRYGAIQYVPPPRRLHSFELIAPVSSSVVAKCTPHLESAVASLVPPAAIAARFA